MTSFAIRNFGCRVNQAEAFAWADELQGSGLRLGSGWEESDYVLVNSCTLTRRADRDVKRFIRKVARTNPGARMIVTGCYAERARGDIEALPGVWMVVGNGGKETLAAKILEDVGIDKAAGASPVPPEAKILEDVGAPSVPHSAVAACGPDGAAETAAYRARAFVKIQDGCDCRCAYCVIPSVRGGSASAGEEDVLSRVRALAGRGYREIVLSGIHLSSYGLDLAPRSSLLGLLRRVADQDERVRTRLSSLDPRFTDGALAEAFAAVPRVAPHFHLALQSGSRKILKAMGRDSDPGANAETIRRFRAASPDAALGADIIVGFPGETDEDFEETRSWIAGSALTYVHVFPFSPREGTPAAGMIPPDDAVASRRASLLRALSGDKDLEFRERFIGRELEAVVIARTGPGGVVLTGNAIRVELADCPAARREKVVVRITGASAAGTTGAL